MPLRRPEFYLTSVVGQGGMGRGGSVTPGGGGGGGAVSPYTLLTQAAAGGLNSATTGAISTVGATLIVVGTTRFQFGGAATLSDSANNVWTPLTEQANGVNSRIFYCLNPITSALHTFTWAGTSIVGVVSVASFSGGRSVSPYESENGATGTSASASPGAITPAKAASLLISHVAFDTDASAPTVASPFTRGAGVPQAGSNYGGYLAYDVSAPVAALDSTWTLAGSNSWASTAACFRSAA